MVNVLECDSTRRPLPREGKSSDPEQHAMSLTVDDLYYRTFALQLAVLLYSLSNTKPKDESTIGLSYQIKEWYFYSHRSSP